jgi:hypothetical protein
MDRPGDLQLYQFCRHKHAGYPEPARVFLYVVKPKMFGFSYRDFDFREACMEKFVVTVSVANFSGIVRKPKTELKEIKAKKSFSFYTGSNRAGLNRAC